MVSGSCCGVEDVAVVVVAPVSVVVVVLLVTTGRLAAHWISARIMSSSVSMFAGKVASFPPDAAGLVVARCEFSSSEGGS